MTALPKGEPRVCAPLLYRRIPRRREAVRPYNRLPYLRPILALSFRASDRRHWRGNPFPLASLCEGGVKTKGFDGGRDMPQQRRGIRGDVGIAPYGMITDSRA